MKLILSVVSKRDAKAVIGALMRGGFQVTRLSSTGGFLQTGSASLLCVTENERVESALTVIKEHSKKRTFSSAHIPNEAKAILNYDGKTGNAHSVVMGGASCCVLNVEEVYRF